MQTISKTQSTLLPNQSQAILPETVPSQPQIHNPDIMATLAPSLGEATAFWTIIAIAIFTKSTILSITILVKAILEKQSVDRMD